MPQDQQILFPLSGMDQDSDLSKVKEGDYLSALNIRQLTDSGQTTHAIEPTKGNQRSYTIPPVVAQNKKYRFTNIPTGTFTFSPAWQITMTIGSTVILTITLSGGFYPNISVFEDFLNNSFSNPVITNVTTTLGTDYIDLELEISGSIGNEYTLEVNDDSIEIASIAEAIPLTLEGEMTEINSYDLNSNLFVWSTRASTEIENVLSIKLYYINSAAIAFTTIPNHGLWTGATVKIEGATKQPTANGTWKIIVQLNNRILLKDSPLGVSFTGAETGTISLVYDTVANLSEIGVATHEINTDTWTYTRLIRTKNWNFNVLKKPDIHMEQNNIELWFGWTDDFNVPRVFYYSGDFIIDGAIEGINDAGKYNYEFLEEETRLFLKDAKVKFEFTGQTQTGGNIDAGNWRYSMRLLTENKTPTDWLDLDNPISVFIAVASSANPKLIFGENLSPATPKINNFTVSNIPPGLFSFIELAGVKYKGKAVGSQIIKREAISTDQTSIDLQHTNNETAIISIDPSILILKNVSFPTAKNITAIDNRLLLSNLTTRQVHDFTEWAATFKHALKQKILPAVGDIGVNFGEYQDPNNVHNFMGYMYNETVRFGVKGRLKTGGYTQTFWVDDIKFNTDQTTSDGRRITGLVDYSLAGATSIPATIKVPYIEFERPDFDFIIDGQKVSEIIDQIIIERAEIIQEVLATGVMVLAIRNATPEDDFEYIPSSAIGNFPLVAADGIKARYENGISTQLSYANVFIGTVENVGTFYSPDIFYNNVSVSFQSNDKLLNFGGSPGISEGFDPKDALATPLNYYKQFDGQFKDFESLSINAANILERDSFLTIGSQIYSSKLMIRSDTGNVSFITNWQMEEGLVIETNTKINYINPVGIDNGLRYCQYFREKTNKYGDKTKTQYIPTGAIYDISSTSTIAVFGGDTFTQKTYFRYKHNEPGFASSSLGLVPEWAAEALIFYSQNRVNTQMRSLDSASSDNDFPKTDAKTWLIQNTPPDFLYNKGYNIKNGVNSDRAFDPSLRLQQNMPVRIIYSAIKPQNSLVDTYREFQALNFKDLDLSFGEIVHMANGNNELIAWQKRAFKLLKFNTRNVLVTTNGLELTIGSGVIMSGDDRILSAYGCNNKWSIIEAKSEQGNKMFAWINTEFKKVIRYSFDGTRSLEYIKKMRSFFRNNLDWVKGKDEPSGGEGVHGVWDDEFGELIWTVNGKRVVPSREIIGKVRRGETQPFTIIDTVGTAFTFENEIYEAKEGATNLNFPSTSYWTLISHDNPKYYNEYTIAYNEVKNRFTTFFSFLPKLYLKWENTYHSPKDNTGKTFIHNKGDYCSWYDGEVEEDGYIIPLVNKYSDEKKNFAALRAISEIVPERMDFTTQRQISFLTSSEFETREDEHDAPIKEDSTLTGENDGDTGLLWGKYLKVKFTFKKKVYQKLTDIIVKFRVKARISIK